MNSTGSPTPHRPRPREIATCWVLLVLAWSPVLAGEMEQTAVVTSTEVTTVSRAEFAFEQSFHRAAVAAAFLAGSGETPARITWSDSGDPAFWSDPTDPRSPAALLRVRTLEVLIRLTAERALLREQGIPYPADYDELVASCDRENLRRADALAKGGIVYGPRRYSLAGWRDYLHSTALIALKRRLVATGSIEIAPEDIHREFVAAQRDGRLGTSARLDDCRESLRQRLVDRALDSLVARRIQMTRVVVQ
jgi:hypothetical protein